MSNYLNFQNPDYSKTNIFQANSHYLTKIYAQKERKKENNSLFTFWTPINVENILKPMENSVEKKSSHSQSSSENHDPGSCSDSSSKPKSKRSENSIKKVKKSSKKNHNHFLKMFAFYSMKTKKKKKKSIKRQQRKA